MATGQQFIYTALRKLGALRPGYTASPEMMADALFEWNTFFDSLNNDPACQFSNPSYTYPILGSGSQTGGNGYLVGPSAQHAPATPTTLPGGPNDWQGPRPSSIIAANLIFTNIQPNPVYIRLTPVTQKQWSTLSVLQIGPTQVTSIFWYDPQFPNGIFNVFPPLNGNSIQLYQQGSLVPPAELDSPYSAPPGYEDLVIFGLAKRLYHHVDGLVLREKKPYVQVCSDYDRALEAIQAMNTPIPELAGDAPAGSRTAGGGGGYYDSFVTWTGEPY